MFYVMRRLSDLVTKIFAAIANRVEDQRACVSLIIIGLERVHFLGRINNRPLPALHDSTYKMTLPKLTFHSTINY